MGQRKLQRWEIKIQIPELLKFDRNLNSFFTCIKKEKKLNIKCRCCSNLMQLIYLI